MSREKASFGRWNATKKYVGIYEFDEVTYKDTKVGPGAIYNNGDFLNKYDGVTFIEKVVDGKRHGAYAKWIMSKNYREYGVLSYGKNVGPCLTIENKEGYLTTYDEKQDEHGFYIKFLNDGIDFVIFYFNHGKLSNRCIIKQYNDFYRGSCSSLNNYKKIDSDYLRSSLYRSYPLTLMYFDCKEEPREFKGIVDSDKNVHLGYSVKDYAGKELFAILNLKKNKYIGEVGAYNSIYGGGLMTSTTGEKHIGNFTAGSPGRVLNITKDRYSLLQYEDGKYNDYFFSDHKEYFLIGKYDKGNLCDEAIKIEKETLNVYLCNKKGHVIKSLIFNSTSNNSSINTITKNEVNKQSSTTSVNNTTNKTSNTSTSSSSTYRSSYVPPKKEEPKVIRQGYNVSSYSNGRYEGKYSDDKRHGQGIFYFENGDKYDGSWNHDVMEGYGTYYFANGDKYEGFFKNNVFEGRGTLYHKDKSYETGYWSNGKIKESLTYGKQELSNGYYEGEFLGDERHGQGTYYFSDGRKMEGKWEHNEFTGSGKFTLADGTVFDGYFINGQLEGYCEIIYPSGASRFGTFKNNQAHGYFSYEPGDGYRYQEYYENGKKIS